MILQNIHMIFSASTLLAFFLFITHPWIFSFLLFLVSKQMKVLYMNRTSPVFSLFVYSFSVIAWEIVQTIYVYISISMYINICINVVSLGMIRLKNIVIVLILIWEFKWCKKKANRKTEILFLLLTLLTLYIYMTSERFRWLRASYNLFWLL